MHFRCIGMEGTISIDKGIVDHRAQSLKAEMETYLIDKIVPLKVQEDSRLAE